MWVLGIEPGSYLSMVSALNHQAISQAPSFWFFGILSGDGELQHSRVQESDLLPLQGSCNACRHYQYFNHQHRFYHFHNFTNPLHPQSEKQAENSVGFPTIEENTFGLQQPFIKPQQKDRPWEAMLPQGSLATFFSSYHSNLCPTAWKLHTSTPNRSYQCPSPRTWPRYILPGDLTPQTTQSVISSPSANREDSKTPFHMHAENGDAGLCMWDSLHMQQSAQELTHPMWKGPGPWLFSQQLYDFSKVVISTSPLPICKMGTNMICPEKDTTDQSG